jgi:hypothetical protein
MGFKMKFVDMDQCLGEGKVIIMFERDGPSSASNSQDKGTTDCVSQESDAAGSWFHAAPPPAPKPVSGSGGAFVQQRAGGFSRTTFSVMNHAQTQAERPFVGSLAAGHSTASAKGKGLCMSVTHMYIFRQLTPAPRLLFSHRPGNSGGSSCSTRETPGGTGECRIAEEVN